VIRTTSTTSTTVPGAPVLNGNGAVLRPPPPGTPARPLGAKPDCHSLVDPGFSGSCGTANGRLGLLYWVVETKPGSWRAFVYRGDTPGVATPMLQAIDDDASDFSLVKVNVVDVSGDHADELVFGFHLQGSGAIVSMDVVEGHGVAVHRDYAQGSVRPSPGQIDAWGAVPQAGGASGFAHEVIRAVQGAWRIVASTPVKQSEVPPPQV
jgi:hypothetical protein